MNTTLERLSEAFEPLRSGLRADGADLKVLSLDGSEATAELVIGDQTCLDCILPKQQLEETLLVIGRDVSPELSRVVLRDQREASAKD